MITKKISILLEELQALNEGKTIEFYESEELNLRIKIVGIDMRKV